MIIKIYKRTILVSIGILFMGIITVATLVNLVNPKSKSIVAGGKIYSTLHTFINAVPTSNQQDNNISERFQRPSKQLPFPNPYSFMDFNKNDEQPPLITKRFETPEDLIMAYYGILREAANPSGYSLGGCGTIGLGYLPYPYAYELLSNKKQKEMSFNQFIDSFKGIGYITLLKVFSAYIPPNTPSSIKYYMVEIEVITGVETDKKECNQGSYFAYYYGLITTEYITEEGWKIKEIGYISEDFLCAPAHSWFYLSEAVVQIVYGDNLKIIDGINKSEKKGDMVYIYASGNGKQYRFDFIRITNGYDILLHENVLEGNIWIETNLLTDEWKDFKLTINNSTFCK